MNRSTNNELVLALVGSADVGAYCQHATACSTFGYEVLTTSEQLKSAGFDDGEGGLDETEVPEESYDGDSEEYESYIEAIMEYFGDPSWYYEMEQYYAEMEEYYAEMEEMMYEDAYADQ